MALIAGRSLAACPLQCWAPQYHFLPVPNSPFQASPSPAENCFCWPVSLQTRNRRLDSKGWWACFWSPGFCAAQKGDWTGCRPCWYVPPLRPTAPSPALVVPRLPLSLEVLQQWLLMAGEVEMAEFACHPFCLGVWRPREEEFLLDCRSAPLLSPPPQLMGHILLAKQCWWHLDPARENNEHFSVCYHHVYSDLIKNPSESCHAMITSINPTTWSPHSTGSGCWQNAVCHEMQMDTLKIKF